MKSHPFSAAILSFATTPAPQKFHGKKNDSLGLVEISGRSDILQKKKKIYKKRKEITLDMKNGQLRFSRCLVSFRTACSVRWYASNSNTVNGQISFHSILHTFNISEVLFGNHQQCETHSTNSRLYLKHRHNFFFSLSFVQKPL